MRRTKEDMMKTREMILQSAFRNFYTKGYESTSLEDIVKDIGLTRGAFYWHFKNKPDLFRALIDEIIVDKADITKYPQAICPEWTLAKRMVEIFYVALHDNIYIDFVYKMIIYTAEHPEFEDVLVKLRDLKLRLKHNIEFQIGEHIRKHHLTGKDPEVYASLLFLMFEGMFLCKNIQINVPLTKESMQKNVDHILADILSDSR